jgi:6,7-dimethyl-8-ribityllumazine synthase
MSLRFAVLVSKFNPEVTQGLLAGARDFFREVHLPIHDEDIFDAPGAFEIPLLAQALAETGKYSGVVALGCVIKGDTAHFEFISLGAAVGIQQAVLKTRVPIAFGVLTTYTDEQAILRSRPTPGDPNNKGREAASACYEAARLLKVIQPLSPTA